MPNDWTELENVLTLDGARNLVDTQAGMGKKYATAKQNSMGLRPKHVIQTEQSVLPLDGIRTNTYTSSTG